MVTRLPRLQTLRNRSGASLTMVLGMIGVIGLVSLVAVQFTVGLQKRAAQGRIFANVDSVTETLAALMNNDSICKNGIGGQPGLQFLVSGAPGVFNSALAATATGQDVSMGSNFIDTSSTTPLVLRAGVTIPPMNLKIDRLAISNAILQANMPANSYQGNLVARFEATDRSGTATTERTIATVTLQVDPVTTQLVGCSAGPTVLSICASIGCTYRADAGGQKCVCPFPAMQCPAGQYLSNVAAGGIAVCKPFSVDCSSQGANAYLAGINTDGSPICMLIAPSTPTTTLPATVPPVAVAGACCYRTDTPGDPGNSDTTWDSGFAPQFPDFNSCSAATGDAVSHGSINTQYSWASDGNCTIGSGFY